MAEPPVSADEPGGHGSGLTDDARVPRRVFFGVGAFVALLAIVYWYTSYEEAGTALLALAAVLSLWCGAYLWLQQRPRSDRTAAGADTTAYLPHASVWPFAIGLGAATVLNGLVLGIWVIVPGAALMALGIGGFIGQTRRRD
jgi:cobalamin synthase